MKKEQLWRIIIIHNKNGVFDDVIEVLYEEHLIPDGSKIREVMQEYAGISRELKPKLSVSDLEPDRDYTADELMALLSKKPSMIDQIAAAKARQEGQEKGQSHQPFLQER